MHVTVNVIVYVVRHDHGGFKVLPHCILILDVVAKVVTLCIEVCEISLQVILNLT